MNDTLIRALIIVASAAVLCGILTFIEIPILKRIKAGQNIREEGPQAHLAKAGTPTMGGISMIITFVIFGAALIIWQPQLVPVVLVILFCTLAYAAIGFYDDFLKIAKHQNEGLSSKQKALLQIVIGLVLAFYRFFTGHTSVFIPFYGKMVDFGYFIIPFTVFVFVAMTNAVNLTDGLDGLSSSVTMNASACLGVLLLLGTKHTNHETGISMGYSGDPASAALAFVLCGCCIGFLIFNHHPAKIFMGDTGSLAMGAALSAMAMSDGFDFALPIIGIIYVMEVVSVMIQVYVFKTQNGRRFFRMAPLHHHFELGGWSEEKVDTVFSLVTLAMGALCIYIFTIGF